MGVGEDLDFCWIFIPGRDYGRETIRALALEEFDYDTIIEYFAWGVMQGVLAFKPNPVDTEGAGCLCTYGPSTDERVSEVVIGPALTKHGHYVCLNCMTDIQKEMNRIKKYNGILPSWDSKIRRLA